MQSRLGNIRCVRLAYGYFWSLVAGMQEIAAHDYRNYGIPMQGRDFTSGEFTREFTCAAKFCTKPIELKAFRDRKVARSRSP